MSVSVKQSNIGTLKQLLLHYEPHKETRLKLLDQFRSCKDPFRHFLFDIEQQTWTMETYEFTPASAFEENNNMLQEKKGSSKSVIYMGRKMSPQAAIAFEKASRFLGKGVAKNHQKALCLFELLYYSLNPSTIDSHTLTIKLKQKKKNCHVKYSLIDYIICMTDKDAVITPGVAKLHAFCVATRGISLPTTLMVNKAFH